MIRPFTVRLGFIAIGLVKSKIEAIGGLDG
jgi:hypothetical protein